VKSEKCLGVSSLAVKDESPIISPRVEFGCSARGELKETGAACVRARPTDTASMYLVRILMMEDSESF